MNYFDFYRTKLENIGVSVSENRVINMKNKIELNFKEDGSYRSAIINFDESNKIDCRFSEDKADLFKKYFLFKPSDINSVIEGMYLKIKEGLFLLSEINMSDIYKKGEAYTCNSVLKAKGLPDMPCFADNTTYGVKGLKDNDYFKESDKKLKIKVQANNVTLKYFEGQRFLFGSHSNFTSEEEIKNEWVCYKVNSKDFTVLKNQYVLELTKDVLQPSLDDLINGIAFNKELNTDVDNSKNNEKPDDEVEPDIILNTNKCKVGQVIDISITPDNATLQTDDYGKLRFINPGKYSFTGVKSGDHATLQLIKENKVLKEEYILIY